MTDFKVDVLVPPGSLNQALQEQSVGTDSCAVGVGMVAIMPDGSKWCANFDSSCHKGEHKLADIQAATFSMLTNALRQQPRRLVAATTAELTGVTLAVWKGMQHFFAAAENYASHGVFARKDGGVSVLAASDRLLGPRAHPNAFARIPVPVNHPPGTFAGTVQGAADGAHGFDTDAVLTQTAAQQFAEQGYRFCLRYLSLHDKTVPGDLTAGEAQDILNGGLALMPVQHARRPGWMPTALLGAQYGTHAATQAQSMGLPFCANIWLDLEGVSSRAKAKDVIAYCTSWYEAVKIYRYLPGLYVGYGCGLDGRQLYELPFEHYWKSASLEVPDIPGRGYQMVQKNPDRVVNGLEIDHNTAMADQYGGVAQWWTKAH